MTETVFNTEGTQITLSRELKAPLETVWNAWTDPEKLAKWWGPRGWETTIKTFEFRPGGVWHYCMKCVDESQGEWFGQESWGKATFRDIEPTTRFVYFDEFSNEAGESNTDMPAFEIEMRFESLPDGKTKVTSVSDVGSEEALQKLLETGMEQGIKETWDRLAETVENA